MKRIAISLFFLILLVVSVQTFAQDMPDGCDLAAIDEQLSDLNLADMSLEDALVTLRDLENAITKQRAACAGLSFNSDDEGFQPVLGPIELPDGIWIVTFTTDGFVLLDATTLSGDCGGYDDEFLIIAASQGEANDGASETMTTSDGCSLLVTVGMADENWTLEFTQVRAD